MDEPLSNLDALLRLEIRAELKKLLSELDTTTVYVTHDQVEALSMGDRIAVMREGRIVQVDNPLVVYDNPADTFVGGFIGNPPMNFLEAEVRRTAGVRSPSSAAARSRSPARPRRSPGTRSCSGSAPRRSASRRRPRTGSSGRR